MPWDKKPDQPKTVYATVGAVACYRIKFIKDVNDEDGEENTTWEYTLLWVKGYPVQTGSLFWSPLEDTLYIGFDDGKIQRLKITDNGMSTEVSILRLFNLSVQLPEICGQTLRITGLLALPEVNRLLSVSDSGKL